MNKKTQFLERTFVVLSIMNVKIKYFNEDFVTLSECNAVTKQLKSRLIESKIGIIITDEINRDYFDINGEIILKKVNIEDIQEANFINPIIANVIFDEKFIYNCLCEIKVEELINTLERSCTNCNTHCSGGPEGYICDRWSNDVIISFKKILKR